MRFDAAQRRELLSLARRSISSGMQDRQRPAFPGSVAGGLDIQRASFVTLRIHGELRGCCGSIDAQRPVAEDVWRNAWASAFSDPRFAPLTEEEYARCHLHISVLSELQPLPAHSQQELLDALRPGIDGLLLESSTRQATFLPAVWQQLRDPVEFLRHLKLKAGWEPDTWPTDLRASRYTTESFGEREPE